MENSGIGWTHHTWNPWVGCHKVSEECRFCYIEGNLKRQNREPFKGPIRTKTVWNHPYKWNRLAEEEKTRFRIFTCSLSDFFHEGADKFREDAWKVISECKNLDWLILTKRPENILDRLPEDWGEGYDHVWLGVTVGHRNSLKRLPIFRKVPAKTKFVSAEPLQTNINFSTTLNWIDWIITGCERAAKDKRAIMDMDWVRNIDKQCRDYDVPHYFKQHYAIDEKGNECGEPIYDGLIDGRKVQNFPKGKV